MNKINLGEKIQKKRKLLGLNQFTMAEKLSISHRTYQRIENNESDPDLQLLISILTILGEDPNYFIFQLCKDSQIKNESLFNEKYTKKENQLSNFSICNKTICNLFLEHEIDPTSEIGYWEHNYKTNAFFWSKEMYNIYGIIDKNSTNVTEYLKTNLFPDDLSKIDYDMKNLINNNIPYNNGHRIKTDSKTLFIRAHARKNQKKDHDHLIFGIAYSTKPF